MKMLQFKKILLPLIATVAFVYVAAPRGDRPMASASESAPAPAASAPAGKSLPVKVVAYYFHTTARCYTCKLIEAYTSSTLKQRFAGDLSSGLIEWRSVNVQNPENRHYIQKYQLFTKSVVLARFENGQEKRHKVLADTWNLVGDQIAFEQYIATEVQAMRKGS